MARVTLSGASDDLVEVDGDIREEFGYHDYDGHAGGDLVAFSDGTVLRIRHGENVADHPGRPGFGDVDGGAGG